MAKIHLPARPERLAHEPRHALDTLRDDRRLAPDMAGLAGRLRRERSSRHLRAVPEGTSRQSAAEQPVTNHWSVSSTSVHREWDRSAERKLPSFRERGPMKSGSS